MLRHKRPGFWSAAEQDVEEAVAKARADIAAMTRKMMDRKDPAMMTAPESHWLAWRMMVDRKLARARWIRRVIFALVFGGIIAWMTAANR